MVQGVLLVLGLAALYFAWSSHHAMRKIKGWALFQFDIFLLWCTALSRYHGQINPFSLDLLLVILAASLTVLGLFLILALGVAKRHGLSGLSRIPGGKA